MGPKYEVGEVVLLRSLYHPQRDGEYLVLAATFGTWQTRVSLELVEGWCYHLEGGGELPWAEYSLRKRHTPGELTFDNLMASLSSPELITHQP